MYLSFTIEFQVFSIFFPFGNCLKCSILSGESEFEKSSENTNRSFLLDQYSSINLYTIDLEVAHYQLYFK